MRPHAYLILAHADIALLRVLIGMLDHPRNHIYIHADAKWEGFDASILTTEHSPIHILSERIDVRWGDYSIVAAEFALFAQAFNRGPYAHYHMLSGADFPIKPTSYILEFFDKHPDQEFVTYWKSGPAMADARFKTDRYHFLMRYEKNNLPRILSIGLAKLRFGITNILYRILGPRTYPFTMYKGSNWVSITHQAVALLLDKKDYIQKTLRYTRIPDEIYIQTFLWNSELRANIWQGGDMDYDLRYTDWTSGSPSPKTLTAGDLNDLLHSSCLFARKFSSQESAELIEQIQKYITQES